MKTRFAAAFGLVLVPLLVAAGPFHIEVWDSFPDEDEALVTSPAEIWIQFSVAPDMEQTSFSVRGPEETVELGDIVVDEEDPTIIRAEVSEPIGPGAYTISWVAAAPEDHPERGRWAFTVGASR